MSRARTQAACLKDAARFDWDEYNRQLDAKMNALRQAPAECAAVDAAITRAGRDMARDVRKIMGCSDA